MLADPLWWIRPGESMIGWPALVPWIAPPPGIHLPPTNLTATLPPSIYPCTAWLELTVSGAHYCSCECMRANAGLPASMPNCYAIAKCFMAMAFFVLASIRATHTLLLQRPARIAPLIIYGSQMTVYDPLPVQQSSYQLFILYRFRTHYIKYITVHGRCSVPFHSCFDFFLFLATKTYLTHKPVILFPLILEKRRDGDNVTQGVVLRDRQPSPAISSHCRRKQRQCLMSGCFLSLKEALLVQSKTSAFICNSNSTEDKTGQQKGWFLSYLFSQLVAICEGNSQEN